MDSTAMHGVVTITLHPCVGNRRRPSMHPMTLGAPEEADHPGTPHPSTTDNVPVGPLTGSPTATHPAIASPTVLPAAPPAVYPPSV